MRRFSAGGVIVNYLGHFEGAGSFGCHAGSKMVYVDAIGEVSPCVFLPFSFGNVRERPLAEGGSAALPFDRRRTTTTLAHADFGPASPLSYFRGRLMIKLAESE